MKPKVLIVMGSDSDLPLMEETGKALSEFGIPYRMTIASAHRSPDLVEEVVRQAGKDGVEVIIAGAGAAAHLAGVIASRTILPVIGVPIDSSPLKGLDSLFSTVQMPPGVPVATMAVGKAGARNAGIFAAQIMARSDRKLAKLLAGYRKKLEAGVRKKAEKALKSGK
ncbi:MAG: 5-(carboxyamino)imidazole ribonucleotide mutase [Nitrospiraceae bacterium]|nr:5-(carboxyamino)imidazole ribonucleotide mutase [Nitrospiraceae bacterium]